MQNVICYNEREVKKDNNNNQEVIVSVKDNGEGIHPEILPKLFTKFATKSTRSGIGLGLFITKKLLKLMEVRFGLKIMQMKEELPLALV